VPPLESVTSHAVSTALTLTLTINGKEMIENIVMARGEKFFDISMVILSSL
jgi:hypothetical protein